MASTRSWSIGAVGRDQLGLPPSQSLHHHSPSGTFSKPQQLGWNDAVHPNPSQQSNASSASPTPHVRHRSSHRSSSLPGLYPTSTVDRMSSSLRRWRPRVRVSSAVLTAAYHCRKALRESWARWSTNTRGQISSMWLSNMGSPCSLVAFGVRSTSITKGILEACRCSTSVSATFFSLTYSSANSTWLSYPGLTNSTFSFLNCA
mmetsp:Transcript_3301/g.8437  ORF Transcript_3301/g.8437 Transcript_3301/m.8437 type:complete len:203 (-) Transcript_3301:393-1001(-)